MPTKTSTCILCSTGPTTAAHLFASPIRAEFADDKQLTYRMREPVDPSRYVRTTQRVGSGLMHVQPRVLCQGCNGAWMSSIEQAAAPVVVQMVRGESMTLGTETQRAVAEWAVAVAILRAELVPGDHSFDRAAGRAFREHGLEAVDIGVWAVNVDLTYDGLRGGAATTYLRGEADGVVGAVALLWLRRVCFIIAQEPYRSRFERRVRGIAAAVVRLPSNDEQTWPPERAIADSTFLEVLELGELLTPEFLDTSGAAPGRLTEQVLRIKEPDPAADLDREVMAWRIAAASDGPWPQPICRDDR